MTKEIKAIYFTFLFSIFSAITHNYLYFKLGKEEGVFFVLSALALISFVFAIINSVTKLITEQGPSDLWMIGFLGLTGLLGFVPGIGIIFFGFFGFFLFFFLKLGQSLNNIFKNISVVIALIAIIGALVINFYQIIVSNQDNAYYLFKFMQEEETLKEINFSEIERVLFYWPSKTDPIRGKGFEEMTITTNQYDVLRNFFERAGFGLDFFDIESTTNAGVSGYIKENVWCVLKAGLYYEEGNPVAEDKMRCNIYCAQID